MLRAKNKRIMKSFIVVFKNGDVLQRSNGIAYYFDTSKAAIRCVDICYGLSFFKKGLLKVKRVNEPANNF